MKKIGATLLGLSLFGLVLSGCNAPVNVPSQESGETEINENDPKYQIYLKAKEAGYDGTYEEWLNSIRGADGTSLLCGVVNPAAELGKNGDIFINTVSWDIFVKVGGSWSKIGNIMGPKGEPGKDGENGLTPYIGENGNWWIGDTDTGVSAKGKQGENGLTPFIGENGNWWIGDTDTGISAEGKQGEPGKDGQDGKDGKDGETPYVGENGNWWIGNIDTGVKAEGKDGESGKDGETPYVGLNGNWWIGDKDLGISATGEKGQDGSSFLSDFGYPNDSFGRDGDTYLDFNTFSFFKKINGKWVYQTSMAYAYIDYDFSPSKLSLGETRVLKATIQMGYEEFITWSVSDESVLSISNETGSEVTITALSLGNAILTVDYLNQQHQEFEFIVVEDAQTTTINILTNFSNAYSGFFTDTINSIKNKMPNVDIVYSRFSGSYNDLIRNVLNSVPSGDYPDIIVTYPEVVADLIDVGITLNIEPYMHDATYGWTEEEENDFYKPYLQEGNNYIAEGTYSLPIGKSTEALYYDQEKIIGLDLSQIDASINNGQPLTESYINSLTWDELFQKLCPALLAYRETLPTQDEKDAFLNTSSGDQWTVLSYDSDDNFFITLAEQYGYGYTSIDEKGIPSIDFNNQNMKNLLKSFNVYRQNHYLSTMGTLGTYSNYLFADNCALFRVGSTSGVNYQYSAANPKNVGVARVPQADVNNPKIVLQGSSMTFLDHKNSDRALLSWQFYKEFTSVENLANWSIATNYAPLRKSVIQNESFMDFISTSIQQDKTLEKLKAMNFINIINNVENSFVCPLFRGSSKVRLYVGDLMTQCLSGNNLTDDDVDNYFLSAYNNSLYVI